jgi:hypothetical protein
MGGDIRFPVGFEDCADGGFVVSAGLFEAREVMGSEEILAGLVHGVKVQRRITAEPGIIADKRVFAPVDEIGVFPPFGTEAGMHVCRHFRHRNYGYAMG